MTPMRTPPHPRAATGRWTRLLLAALVVALMAPATGCGRKPGDVDPPPGTEEDRFPRTYPST